MRKAICLIALFSGLSIFFCACGRSLEEKRELNIALSTSPLTIDPQLCSDTTSALALDFTSGTLYEYNREGELIPCLAESYDISEDGCTYTFHLKDGLKWSDGRPMCADDFVFAFQRLADPETGSNSIFLITDCCMIRNSNAIAHGEIPASELGVYAPDDRTFIVELEEPCAFFCSLMSKNNFAPCNRDFFYDVGRDFASSSDTVLSSGPYIMDRYEPIAKQIHYVPNPNYVNHKDVSLPGLTLQIVANNQQAVMCYETGDIDITPISGEYLQLTEGDPELHVFPSASGKYYAVNQRSCPELRNRNIRMALLKSIDRESLAKNLLGAGSSPLYSVVPPAFYIENNNMDFESNSERYLEFCGYDPDDAKKLWEEGLNELGVSGISLECVYASGEAGIVEAAAAQMMDSLPGLNIELRPVPFKEMIKRKSSDQYDLCYSGWVADYIDPTSFLALFVSTGDYGYANPEFDELYSRIQSGECVSDPVTRDRLMHEAEDMIMEDAGVIPVVTTGKTYLIHKGITNYQLMPMENLSMAGEIKKEVE
jgi:oligopeptide transport system substrate-binding protein